MANLPYRLTKSTYNPVRRTFSRTIIQIHRKFVDGRIHDLPEIEVNQKLDLKQAKQVVRKYYSDNDVLITNLVYYQDIYTLSIPKFLEHAKKKTIKLN